MITEGILARHTPPGRGRRGPALLDVAQDYALAYLHQEGLFDLGVVLKGGTSLRKFRSGAAGRFSTDLDFVAPDEATVNDVFGCIDGIDFHGVRFAVRNRKGLHAALDVDTDRGRPDIAGKIEVSLRPLWIPTVLLEPVPSPAHRHYEFAMPAMPAPVLEEAVAEKLAAWRRRRKVRDLYDLHWFASTTQFDEALARRLTVLKVWHDVVLDGLGEGPFDPEKVTAASDTKKMPSEEIGLLTRPLVPQEWMDTVASRYRFLLDLDADEAVAAACSRADKYFVSEPVARLNS